MQGYGYRVPAPPTHHASHPWPSLTDSNADREELALFVTPPAPFPSPSVEKGTQKFYLEQEFRSVLCLAEVTA